MIENKPVVYFFNEGKQTGCSQYRLSQPCSKLIEKDYFLCANSRELTPEENDLWIAKCDLIVTQAAMNEKYVDWMYKQKAQHKGRFVIDMDDNIFAVQPENPSYEFHGVREVRWELPDGTIRELKDGMGQFNIARNKARLQTFCDALRIADLVTTPSAVLSGIFKTIAQKDKVKVIKNFIDFSVWKPLKLERDDREVRIGWQGGWSHYRDFLEIEEVLKIIMTAYPRVKLVIMGTVFKGVIDSLPQDRVEIHPWTSIETYPHAFKTLGLDIGLAPLQNNAFNTAKSELKWEEYSALSICTIASNIPPYSLAIQHGETGFLCGNTEDWISTLSKLIELKDLRQKIGNQALIYVREHYDLDREIEQYRTAYLGIAGLRKELVLN